jgi:general stress protein 26
MHDARMEWDEVVDAATRSGWTTYIGTADAAGVPHVAVVAPGFTDGTVWFVTRASSKKLRNLRENTGVAFHWPVGNAAAPGELAAWGAATLHDSDDELRTLWDAGIMSYDLNGFFGSPDETDAVFVEVAVQRARLQTQHGARVWTP